MKVSIKSGGAWGRATRNNGTRMRDCPLKLPRDRFKHAVKMRSFLKPDPGSALHVFKTRWEKFREEESIAGYEM